MAGEFVYPEKYLSIYSMPTSSATFSPYRADFKPPLEVVVMT